MPDESSAPPLGRRRYQTPALTPVAINTNRSELAIQFSDTVPGCTEHKHDSATPGC